ncbi:hypothetical protein D3C76_1612970 [compost metagenome]
MGLEVGQAGIEATLEPLALDTHLEVVTFVRVQGLAEAVLVGLRVENTGVAGIHGIVGVEVIDHANIRHWPAGFSLVIVA